MSAHPKNSQTVPVSACQSEACATHDHRADPAEDKFRGRGFALNVPAMDCALEETEIRDALSPLTGIVDLDFRLASRVLRVDAPDSVAPDVILAIQKAGFSAELLTDPAKEPSPASILHREVLRFSLALALAILAEFIMFFAPDTLLFRGLGMAVSVGAIGLAGFTTYRKGFAAIRRGRLNINALMSVAVTGAFLIGQWPEAAMVMALYAIAELIEARAVVRARSAISQLLDLAPELAELRDEDGSWRQCAVADVKVGQTVRVLPGGRVALDGVIRAGLTALNQAPVTGESIPVDKAPGDPVYAGTINETGLIEVEVTAHASESTLARIIKAVEQAQAARAPTQQLVDRFASVYTPLVFVLALLVALLPPLWLDWTWTESVYKALVILVIACPCALVIATPVTVVSGLAAAARRGILIKGGVYLEQARLLKVLALDKTGTITKGRPSLVASIMLDEQTGRSVDKQTVLSWAYALASQSDHPVACAISQGLADQHASESVEIGDGVADGVADVVALPGFGLKACLGERKLMLVNQRYLKAQDLSNPDLEARLLKHHEQGHSVSILVADGSALAIFAVADIIRAGSSLAVRQLQALGIQCAMLSGDNPVTAQAIAKQAGIEDVHAGLLPDEKLEVLKKFQRERGLTGMVGDGINDSPALAQANVGFAMGGAGTDTAMEAAGIVIMNDDLTRLGETIRLSQATRSILWQNIFLALGIKLFFLVMAIQGNATMWMAVFADMGASLIVVFNGLRLLRVKTQV